MNIQRIDGEAQEKAVVDDRRYPRGQKPALKFVSFKSWSTIGVRERAVSLQYSLTATLRNSKQREEGRAGISFTQDF